MFKRYDQHDLGQSYLTIGLYKGYLLEKIIIIVSCVNVMHLAWMLYVTWSSTMIDIWG